MSSMVSATVPDVWGEDKTLEGVIINWFFPEGARVLEGQVIAEGMVEKVTFEILSPAEGVLHILIPPDVPIKPGMAVAEIEAQG